MSPRRTRQADAQPAPAPSHTALHEAALAYLAKQATTGAMLSRVLERRAATWARKAARAGQEPASIEREVSRCKEAIGEIVARFREVGLVNDAAFATSRANRLSRAGRSRRAIAAHLASKGVDAETARASLPQGTDTELGAALAFARRRHIGPFAREEADDDAKRRAVGAMARAGFAWTVCERVLGMDREQADDKLAAHRDRTFG